MVLEGRGVGRRGERRGAGGAGRGREQGPCLEFSNIREECCRQDMYCEKRSGEGVVGGRWGVGGGQRRLVGIFTMNSYNNI